VRLEGLGKLKNPPHPVIRTGDLPACSIVPQPTTLPRAPKDEIVSMLKKAVVAYVNVLSLTFAYKAFHFDWVSSAKSLCKTW
jgi:hypothetical protein